MYKNMKNLLIGVICITMFLCKPNSGPNISEMHAEKLCKIEYLNYSEILFSSEDKDRIVKFAKYLLAATLDTSGINYKSLEFVKFYDCSGRQYRIGLVVNRFVAGGVKYIVPENIKSYFESLFSIKLSD